MRHFVQYHNPDRFGPPRPYQEGEPYYVMTSKRPERVPGNCVWLIGGEGRPRRYFLRKVFIVDRWQAVEDPDFFFRLTGERGVPFQPAVEITGYPWFEQMKHNLANFSLGLTDITGSYARYLITLARELSPAYREAEGMGWFALPDGQKP